jgi:hypothetical protein
MTPPKAALSMGEAIRDVPAALGSDAVQGLFTSADKS